MRLVQIACGCLAAFTYGTFIFGFFKVFVRKGKASSKLDRLSAFALIAAVAQVSAIVASESTDWLGLLLGVILYLLALSLFFWTARAIRKQPLSLAFSPDAPEFLYSVGPYRWVRHPFYSSYLLSYVAGWVLSHNHWLLIVIGVMTWIYIDAARTEEQKFSNSPLSAEYEKYRATTGMFFPRLFGFGPNSG